MTWPTIKPRRPYDDDEPEGYLESDDDYYRNNQEAAIWLLDNFEAKLKEAYIRGVNDAHLGTNTDEHIEEDWPAALASLITSENNK